jgi:hypothetical protein
MDNPNGEKIKEILDSYNIEIIKSVSILDTNLDTFTELILELKKHETIKEAEDTIIKLNKVKKRIKKLGCSIKLVK